MPYFYAPVSRITNEMSVLEKEMNVGGKDQNTGDIFHFCVFHLQLQLFLSCTWLLFWYCTTYCSYYADIVFTLKQAGWNKNFKHMDVQYNLLHQHPCYYGI
ncbi:hypothetical protein T06_4111 [Trichinella sp. T6]|nr:hypothetical protein T06_4111 [Trichinella sp. T6]